MLLKIELLTIQELEEETKNRNLEYQCELGRRYLTGTDVNKDLNEAFELIEDSVSKGFYKAQNSLGVIYFNGEGVEEDKNRLFIGLKSKVNPISWTKYNWEDLWGFIMKLKL